NECEAGHIGFLHHRSDRNAARSSAEKSSGCSHAAKCPPEGMRSPVRASERPGCDAEIPSEVAGKGALIAKPAVERDLTERGLGFHQQPRRPVEPSLHQVGVRGSSDRLLECPGEMAPREAGNLRQRLQTDVLSEMVVDILAHAA